MNSIKKYIVMTLIVISGIIVASQNAISQCATDCTEPWVTALTPMTVTVGEGCVYTVNYQTRNCGGVIEMRLLLPYIPVDITNCPGFDPADISWFAAMQMLDALMSNSNVVIPNCVSTGGGGGVETGGGGNVDPNSMVSAIRVVTAACTFTKECTTTFDRVVATDCNYGNPTSESYTLTETHSEELPCGTACCIRKYKLCRQQPSGQILMIQDGTQLIGTCSNESTYSPETCNFECDN